MLSRYGLPRDAAAMRRPLIGMISRMVDQKGFDLIAALAERAAAARRAVRRARHRRGALSGDVDAAGRSPSAIASARGSDSTRRWRISSKAARTSS